MPLHGSHEQLKMVRLFNKFLNNKKSNSSIYYTNKFSIYQIENKIKKYYDLISFLECDIKFYDLTYIEEDDYNFINDVNSLNQYDIFEKSEFLIYDLDGYYINDKKYRNWIYNHEINLLIDYCFNKINILENSIIKHNINIGINLALLYYNYK